MPCFWRLLSLTLVLAVGGCASRRSNDEGTQRIHPADSVQATPDTATYRVRDSVPDTTTPGRRDTTTSR